MGRGVGDHPGLNGTQVRSGPAPDRGDPVPAHPSPVFAVTALAVDAKVSPLSRSDPLHFGHTFAGRAKGGTRLVGPPRPRVRPQAGGCDGAR